MAEGKELQERSGLFTPERGQQLAWTGGEAALQEAAAAPAWGGQGRGALEGRDPDNRTHRSGVWKTRTRSPWERDLDSIGPREGLCSHGWPGHSAVPEAAGRGGPEVCIPHRLLVTPDARRWPRPCSAVFLDGLPAMGGQEGAEGMAGHSPGPSTRAAALPGGLLVSPAPRRVGGGGETRTSRGPTRRPCTGDTGIIDFFSTLMGV